MDKIDNQKGGSLDVMNLRKNIREIMENEIKSKKNADASLSSSFNYNMMWTQYIIKKLLKGQYFI